jgi:HSP20 family protein
MALPVLRSPNAVATTGGTPWDPWRELTDLQARMGQLMKSVFEPLQEAAQAWQPLADLSETDDGYVLEVELPGVKRGDISIEVTGNQLTISGEFKEKEKSGLLRSRTRRVGRFEYRTLLPQEVDADKVTASLAEGVLTVSVPKSATAKPRKVEISQG